MKEAEGKKKTATKDKKHHDHNVPSYLKNESTADAAAKTAEQKSKK